MKNKGIKIIFSFIFFLLLLSFNTNVNGITRSELFIRRTIPKGEGNNYVSTGKFKTKMVEKNSTSATTIYADSNNNTREGAIAACQRKAEADPYSYCIPNEAWQQKVSNTINGTLEDRYSWDSTKVDTRWVYFCKDKFLNKYENARSRECKPIKGKERLCYSDTPRDECIVHGCTYIGPVDKETCEAKNKTSKICTIPGEQPKLINPQEKTCSETTYTDGKWAIKLYTTTKSTTAKIHENKIFQFSVVRYKYDPNPNAEIPVLNPAYCINPGRIGPHSPDKGRPYCEQGSFNLKNCSKNLSESYYCGLGEILYRTMNKKWVKKEVKVGEKYVSYLTLKPSNTYDYGQIVTALRMWTAWYQSDKLNKFKELSDVDGLGMETVLTESGGWTNEPVYRTTAEHVVSAGYRGEYCGVVNKENILCAQDGDKVELDQIKETINLFLFAFNMFSGSSDDPFMGGMFDDDGEKEIIGQTEVVSEIKDSKVLFRVKTTNIVDDGKFECKFDENGKVKTSIQIDANGKPKKINEGENPACKVICKTNDKGESNCTKEESYYIIDENNQLVPVENVELDCTDKGTCYLVISFRASCEKTHPETQEKLKVLRYKLVTYRKPKIKEKTLSFGDIRQYADCESPKKYQVMMTTPFADDAWYFSGGKVIERQYKNGNEWVVFYPIDITAWEEYKIGEAIVRCENCNENEQCTHKNFINSPITGKSENNKEGNIIPSSSCGETYYGNKEESYTNKDPNISCILNACNPEDKDRYSISDDVGANKNICNIYCREEAKFYLSTKAKSYAGMQFSYDILNTFNDKDKKNGLDYGINQKITNIVSLRKQCVSEIYYNKDSLYGTKYSGESDLDALRDCNFLDTGENSLYSKIKKKFECSDSNPEACVKLSAEYDNKIINYESEKRFEEDLKWCSEKEGKGNCLKFDKGKINENQSICTTKDCKSKCANGKECELKDAVPINDYAELDINMQTYFYVPNKYISVPYTGETIKVDKDDSVSSTKNTNILNDYVYPISDLETKFGKNPGYEIKYKFTNLFMNMKSLGVSDYSNEFDYSCSFDVYNITNKYDCAIAIDNNKQLDVSNCKNSCFEMKNGVPVISDECSSFDIRDKKNYGFIYRNIDLANPFPSEDGDDDLKRDSGLNWSIENEAARDAIDEIKLSAEEIFTNPDYLEYSYTITPDGIQRIREYNADAIKDGGYRNNTIDGCETDSVYGYKNCKSGFLNDIIKNWGNDVIVNKEVRGE